MEKAVPPQDYSSDHSLVPRPPSDAIAISLGEAQLAEMSRRMGLSVVLGGIAAAVMLFILNEAVQPAWLLPWFGIVLVANLVRIGVTRLYGQALESRQAAWSLTPSSSHRAFIERWLKYQAVAAFATGIAWGILPLLLPPTEPRLEFMVAAVIGAIAISSLGVYGSLKSYAYFGLPILIGQSFALAFEPEHYPMLFTWLFAGALLLAFARNTADSLRTGLERGIRLEGVAAEERALLDILSSGVLVTRDGIIVNCNDVFLQMLGHSREALIGQGIEAIVLARSGPDGVIPPRTHFEADETVQSRERCRGGDGQIIDLMAKYRRFETGDGSQTVISTWRDTLQERLRASEAFHRHLIEASNSLIWHSDEHGVFTYANDLGAQELYGVTARELLGSSVGLLCAPESASFSDLFHIMDGRNPEPVRNVEMVHVNKAGRRVYVSVNAVPVFNDHDGSIMGYMGINTDITHLKRRERAFQDSVRLQRLIFDSAGEGIVMIRNGRVHRANQAFGDLVGTTVGDIVARPLATWFAERTEWEMVEQQLADLGNVIKVEQQVKRSDGRQLWVSVTGRIAGTGEEGQTFIWVFADISARKEQEEQSWYRANHDELTGLPNRRLLQDRFEQALVRAKRESMRMGVLMLDLDGFKEINDVYGHKAGDEVLRGVARRLTQSVRQLDTVARLGGDEFVIVLHRVAAQNDVEVMAGRIIEQIRQPIESSGNVYRVSTSLGASIYPDTGDGIAGLMHAADMAMYAAKASGKNTYRIAAPAGGRNTAQFAQSQDSSSGLD